MNIPHLFRYGLTHSRFLVQSCRAKKEKKGRESGQGVKVRQEAVIRKGRAMGRRKAVALVFVCAGVFEDEGQMLQVSQPGLGWS